MPAPIVPAPITPTMSPGPAISDEFDRVERLAAVEAVADRAALRRPEDIVPPRVAGCAVWAPDAGLEVDERRRGGGRTRRGDPGGPQRLAPGGADAVARPGDLEGRDD